MLFYRMDGWLPQRSHPQPVAPGRTAFTRYRKIEEFRLLLSNMRYTRDGTSESY